MNDHLKAAELAAEQRRERDQITDDIERMCDPEGERRMIVHLKKRDGSRIALKVEGEHLERVLALADSDPSIDLGEPRG